MNMVQLPDCKYTFELVYEGGVLFLRLLQNSLTVRKCKIDARSHNVRLLTSFAAPGVAHWDDREMECVRGHHK